MKAEDNQGPQSHLCLELERTQMSFVEMGKTGVAVLGASSFQMGSDQKGCLCLRCFVVR